MKSPRWKNETTSTNPRSRIRASSPGREIFMTHYIIIYSRCRWPTSYNLSIECVAYNIISDFFFFIPFLFIRNGRIVLVMFRWIPFARRLLRRALHTSSLCACFHKRPGGSNYKVLGGEVNITIIILYDFAIKGYIAYYYYTLHVCTLHMYV